MRELKHSSPHLNCEKQEYSNCCHGKQVGSHSTLASFSSWLNGGFQIDFKFKVVTKAGVLAVVI